jgi:hypothetical protein
MTLRAEAAIWAAASAIAAAAIAAAIAYPQPPAPPSCFSSRRPVLIAGAGAQDCRSERVVTTYLGAFQRQTTTLGPPPYCGTSTTTPPHR